MCELQSGSSEKHCLLYIIKRRKSSLQHILRLLHQLKDEPIIKSETRIRQSQYLNNIVEQDHRFIKKIKNRMLGFKSFQAVDSTLKGIEAMHMLGKGQVELQNSPVSSVVKFINNLTYTCDRCMSRYFL